MFGGANIYRRKTIWKLVLLLVAASIGLGSLFYTNTLIEELKEEEKEIVRHWAEATGLVAKTDGDEILTFLVSIIEENNIIPVIWVDAGDNIKSYINFNPSRVEVPGYLEEQLAKMKETSEPIEIDIGGEETDYIYYKESIILTKLIYYPYIQLLIIITFIAIAYVAFSMSRKAEQNQVWVGMSKETAHQLGTPTSSLAGWAELMKRDLPDNPVSDELARDVVRLEKITDRFSKIGSKPELKDENLVMVIHQSLEYLKSRSGTRIEFIIEEADKEIMVPLNRVLFEWVLENLCKNAIDAMSGEGRIVIRTAESSGRVIMDIEDTGKGMPKSAYKSIFKPGYTTKERGWGLGLSLTKRIIEFYHDGKIFVKQSDPGKGSVFRIILHK